MTGIARIPRTRGVLSGLLLVLLGAWGGLIPFIGPYFHYAYTPDRAWQYSTGRLWLEILPGAAALLGGLIVLGSARRPVALFGAFVAALAGGWFITGNLVSTLWNGGVPQAGVPAGTNITRLALEELGFFTGLGALIVFFAALALGRFLVVGVKEVAIAERANAAAADDAAAADAAAAENADAPATGRRFGRKPVATEPVATEPVATEPVATERATDTPAAGETVADGTADGVTSRRRLWSRAPASTDAAGDPVPARDADGDGRLDDEEDAPKTGVFTRLACPRPATGRGGPAACGPGQAHAVRVRRWPGHRARAPG
jgi:hypothetical protein